MNIEIKKSKKPIKYKDAIEFMEQRLLEVNKKKSKATDIFLGSLIILLKYSSQYD